jgi:hypothetical protein
MSGASGKWVGFKMNIARVVDSKGCNSQHKVGNKFYFDGAGNLLTNFLPVGFVSMP